MLFFRLSCGEPTTIESNGMLKGSKFIIKQTVDNNTRIKARELFAFR